MKLCPSEVNYLEGLEISDRAVLSPSGPLWSAHHLGLLLEAWNRGAELAWRARKLWRKHRASIRVKIKVVWREGELSIKTEGTFSYTFNLGICPRKPTQKFLSKIEKAFLNGFTSTWCIEEPPGLLYI